jgi:thiamine-monophosphate kinase
VDEFELIRRYFTFSREALAWPDMAVGDDCSLLSLPAGTQLAVSTDTLVEGVHFPLDADPSLLARRALRVNLSDLAAMSARPLGFQLALTLPGLDRDWLKLFSAGLEEDARRYHCPLVGGDTTRGPLSLTISVFGCVPAGQAILRSGARVGDDIYVTGQLGAAAAAVSGLDNLPRESCLWQCYWLPEPRLDIAPQLRGRASAALDISDGLLQDIGHIVRASSSACGQPLRARIDLDSVPVSPQVVDSVGLEQARQAALAGGDDYELCFTAPVASREMLANLGQRYRIGSIIASNEMGVEVVDGHGVIINSGSGGYNHFPE